MSENPPAIGIDLGTTYSCVAVYRNGNVEVLSNEHENRVTPSCVAYTDDGILVGEDAKMQMLIQPQNTIYDSKRLIGRRTKDGVVSQERNMWPFEIVTEKNRMKLKVEYKKSVLTVFPEQISSLILLKMKEIAELRLGMKIQDAVITVPAYFNNAQRQATKDAGIIAGLNILRIINEPTAASLAYGLDKLVTPKNIIIYDLGGGTFDVTVFRMDEGVFEVKATTGDSFLGGQDFTNKLVVYCQNEIEKTHPGIQFTTIMLAELKNQCENAKLHLSSAQRTIVNFNYNDTSIQLSITRACFEDINKDVFNRTLYFVEKALVDAELDQSDIDEVVLVGGSTRIPKVRSILKDFFTGKTLNFTLHPDECVACGAAVQAALITNSTNMKTVSFFDVVPMSLGIKTANGNMSVIIKRNSRMPTSRIHKYSTSKVNQTKAKVEIFEGERLTADDNNKLDELIIENIPMQIAEKAIIDIIFSVDENGILTVTAEEKSESVKTTTIINPKFDRFSFEEIDKMTEEAKCYQMEDKERAKINIARFKLESFLNEIESDCTFNLRPISNSNKVILLTESETISSWLKENVNLSVNEYTEKYIEFKKFCNKYLK